MGRLTGQHDVRSPNMMSGRGACAFLPGCVRFMRSHRTESGKATGQNRPKPPATTCAQKRVHTNLHQPIPTYAEIVTALHYVPISARGQAHALWTSTKKDRHRQPATCHDQRATVDEEDASPAPSRQIEQVPTLGVHGRPSAPIAAATPTPVLRRDRRATSTRRTHHRRIHAPAYSSPHPRR